MWQRMAALSLALLSGCVSTGEYQDLETKYQHQLAVKEVMETEHDELSQRVDNVSQVYRHVAQEQMGLKAQAEKLQGDILTVKGVVKDTQNQYESQRAQFAQQAQQLSGVDARLQNIAGKIETLTETTVALANRFERVELSIGKLGKSLQARGGAPDVQKTRVQLGEGKSGSAPKTEPVAKAGSPNMEGSVGAGGSGVEPSGTSLAVAPSPVATTTVPAKLDVPMPVPQRVIEAKVESPRTKPDADKGWLRRFLDGFRGGNGQNAELVSPPLASGMSGKASTGRPLLPAVDGEVMAAPMNTLTISIDADAPKKAEVSPSDTEKR
ncbi:MAG TPA: hypothetical protein PKL59_16865 [Nitrospira sp.]|nr:hypothetical protein [Nitrospira sp.]